MGFNMFNTADKTWLFNQLACFQSMFNNPFCFNSFRVWIFVCFFALFVFFCAAFKVGIPDGFSFRSRKSLALRNIIAEFARIEVSVFNKRMFVKF